MNCFFRDQSLSVYCCILVTDECTLICDMLRIEGNITHQSRNFHIILNLGKKSAIKSVSKDKRKIPHTVFGVVQSSIRTENLEAIS